MGDSMFPRRCEAGPSCRDGGGDGKDYTQTINKGAGHKNIFDLRLYYLKKRFSLS